MRLGTVNSQNVHAVTCYCTKTCEVHSLPWKGRARESASDKVVKFGEGAAAVKVTTASFTCCLDQDAEAHLLAARAETRAETTFNWLKDIRHETCPGCPF